MCFDCAFRERSFYARHSFQCLHVIIHLTLTATHEVGVDAVFILQFWKMM